MSGQETTTIYLADGRVLKGERTWFLVDVGVGRWQRTGPPTEWRFTLDGEPIGRAEAEALVRAEIVANPSEAAGRIESVNRPGGAANTPGPTPKD